jgi:hypothetical protein
MAHTPEASMSSPASSQANLRRDDVRGGAPRASGSVRAAEDELFERAAARLRPAWATDVLPKTLPEAPRDAELHEPSSSAAARHDAPTHHEPERDEPVSGLTALPSASDEAGGRDASGHDAQPVFAAAQSAFPTQPPPSDELSGMGAEREQIAAQAPRPARNVRLLAMASAACLALVTSWSLLSDGAREAKPRAAAVEPQVAPTRGTPGGAGALNAATRAAHEPPAPVAKTPSVPRGLEMPLDQPASSPPVQGAQASGAKPSRELPSNAPASNAAKSNVAKSNVAPNKATSHAAIDRASATKAVTKPATAKPVVKASKPAPRKASASKRVGAKATTATRIAKAKPPARAKPSVAAPVTAKRKAATKPQPKLEAAPPKRKRATTAVLDPWGT